MKILNFFNNSGPFPYLFISLMSDVNFKIFIYHRFVSNNLKILYYWKYSLGLKLLKRNLFNFTIFIRQYF